MNKPIFVLLIEDEESEQNEFKNCLAKYDDIKLIGLTNSGDEGLELTKNNHPDVIILDLQLSEGTGSGFEFLYSLKKLDLPFRPFIIVTTIIKSKKVDHILSKNGVDFTFWKQQKDYNPGKVLDMIIMVAPELRSFPRNSSENSIKDSIAPEAYKQMIYGRIEREIELIGISPKMNGKKYITDAIYFLLTDKEGDSARSVYKEIANIHKKGVTTIAQGINAAILKAWRTNDIDELQEHYTAKVSVNSGAPTATEFIYYYVDKLRKELS